MNRESIIIAVATIIGLVAGEFLWFTFRGAGPAHETVSISTCDNSVAWGRADRALDLLSDCRQALVQCQARGGGR